MQSENTSSSEYIANKTDIVSYKLFFFRYSVFGWGVPGILLAASIMVQYHDKAGKLLDTASLKSQNCW